LHNERSEPLPLRLLLSEALKLLTPRQRPYLVGPFVDWSGYSFPGGHTMSATLLYGLVAVYLLPRLRSRQLRMLAVSGAALVTLLVGFSRIALGAHFLTDVLAAMIMGLVWLALCSNLVQATRRRRNAVVVPASVCEARPETAAT
jgi:undecaprenyl-diphosphatase